MPLTSFATAFALGRPPEKPIKLIPPVQSTATAPELKPITSRSIPGSTPPPQPTIPDLKSIIFGPPRPLGSSHTRSFDPTEDGPRTAQDELKERDEEFHHPKAKDAPQPVLVAPRTPDRPTTMEPPKSWVLKDRFGVTWYGATKEGVESWVAGRNAQATWYSYGQVPAGTCYGGRCGR